MNVTMKNEEAYTMKVYSKALVVAGLCASMTFGLAGCGSEAPDGSQVVATVGEKNVTLGEANFYLRYQQVQSEYYYEAMLGQGIYEMDLYGDGSTYGEKLKADIMDQMHQYYILEEKAADYGVILTEEDYAAISAAATAFLDANSAETLAQMTADQETVERMLTLATLSKRVGNAIYSEADITVTEAEAIQRGFEYVKVSKGSGEEALTEEEIAAEKETLKTAVSKVKGGAVLGEVVAEMELTASKGSYGPANASSYDEALINALGGLSEGGITEVIETEDALYIAQLTAEYDEAATANMYSSLVTAQQNEYYSSCMGQWVEEYPLTVDEAVWGTIVFDRSYDLVTK